MVRGSSGGLGGVSAASVRDVWAVGSSSAGPLFLHWNGASWSLMVRGSSGGLGGVSAASVRDVWAVGSSSAGPLFLHWNGKNWSHGKAAAFPRTAGLSAVDALSGHDAWAVGTAYSLAIGAYVTLAAQWNGSRWSPVATPPIAKRGGQAGLSTVSGTSKKDVWAGGNYCPPGCKTEHALMLHWNGRKWLQPSLPRGTSDIFTVKALSPANAWALGLMITTGNIGTTVMLHWNGTRWLKVAIPQDFPMTMTFVSPSDGWAIGLADPVLHWNGTRWQPGQVSTPNWGGGVNGASGDAANDVWAVGERCTGTCPAGVGLTRGLILHWNGSKWLVI